MSNPLLFRRLLGGILIVALIVVVAVTVRFFIESSRKEKPASFQFGADIGLKAIHFTENEAGRKKWELFAESGEYDKASEKSTLSGIRFIVESDRKGPVTVTARQGEYFHSTRYLILKGGIVARTKDGASFETPGLTYNSKTRIFNTKEHVSFADKGLKVEGVGMDFTVDGFEAKIHSRVSATLDPGMREK
jgi:lipopolysaccharide export system protein LptC